MGTTASNDRDQSGPADGRALSPERRLAAIADIIARGLARVLMAEDLGARQDDAQPAQDPVNTPGSALIDAPRTALMVRRGDEAANQGGRTR